MSRTFARVFHNRQHTVQFAVLSGTYGYLVTRQAPLEAPETVETFPIASYNGSWKDCREAAADYARDRAKKE